MRLKEGETLKEYTVTLREDDIDFIVEALSHFTNMKLFNNANNRIIVAHIKKKLKGVKV
jgi:hypothetical protein